MYRTIFLLTVHGFSSSLGHARHLLFMVQLQGLVINTLIKSPTFWDENPIYILSEVQPKTGTPIKL